MNTITIQTRRGLMKYQHESNCTMSIDSSYSRCNTSGSKSYCNNSNAGRSACHSPLHTTLLHDNVNNNHHKNESSNIPSSSLSTSSSSSSSQSTQRNFETFETLHQFPNSDILKNIQNHIHGISTLYCCILILALVPFHANALSSSSPSFHYQHSHHHHHHHHHDASSNVNNALDLLNTARLLREQKSGTTTAITTTNNKQQQQQKKQLKAKKIVSTFNNNEIQSLALQELLQRTAESSASRYHNVGSSSGSDNNSIGSRKSTSSFKTNRQSSSSSSWTQALFDDDIHNDDVLSAALLSKEDSFISRRVQKQLPSVKSLLQTSYGNDVPDMELHLQMEAARARGMKEGSSVAALAFMDLHHGGSVGIGVGGLGEESDVMLGSSTLTSTGSTSYGSGTGNAMKRFYSATATRKQTKMNMAQRKATTVSTIEKVAMSSLPSQLPGIAAPVLNGNSGGRRVVNDVSVGRTRRAKVQTSDAATTDAKITKGKRKKKIVIPTSSISNKKTVKSSSSRSGNNISSSKRNDIDHEDEIQKSINEEITIKLPSPIKKIDTQHVSNIMSVRKALNDQSSSTERVSHDEEIALARIIQRGSQLHSIKTKFEEKNNRDITRAEWVKLAQLDSPKELRRLVSDYRKAKNKLVMSNMGLVHAVVRGRMRESGRATVSYDGVSYEEMVQEGSLGLLRAAELFDPSRGLRFSTYATIWIKGILGNSSLSEAITLPLREKNKWRKIQQAIEDISAEKGVDENGAEYKPSEEEIASYCGIKEEEIKVIMTKMKHTRNVLSLDYQYDSQTRSGVENGQFDALSNDKNMMDDVDLVERLQLRADVVAALTKNLDPREARLMRLRYGLNDGKTRSIRDCAEAMGISKARAQQLAVGCLKKLREADDAESLQEYLLSVA